MGRGGLRRQKTVRAAFSEGVSPPPLHESARQRRDEDRGLTQRKAGPEAEFKEVQADCGEGRSRRFPGRVT